MVRTGGAGNLTEHKYYVGDVIITQRSGGTDTFYTHKDFQGSVVATSNQNGAVISQAIYDPFGKRSAVYRHIDLIAGSYTEPTEKGYTGHKEIPELDIIHMKGRIYDANLGRFLQADPLVQSPMSSQSYNRYSYVFNNPMTYTDPSGFSAWTDFRDKILKPLVAIVVSVYLPMFAKLAWGLGPVASGALTGFVAGGIATGSLRGAVTGAITGAMFGSLHGVEGGNGLMGHAMTGGIGSVLNGGKFGHGFFSAGFTKGLSMSDSVFVDGDRVGNAVKAAVIGGTVSKATGGKFANGAVTGAFSRLLNDEAYDSDENYDDEDEKNFVFDEDESRKLLEHMFPGSTKGIEILSYDTRVMATQMYQDALIHHFKFADLVKSGIPSTAARNVLFKALKIDSSFSKNIFDAKLAINPAKSSVEVLQRLGPISAISVKGAIGIVYANKIRELKYD